MNSDHAAAILSWRRTLVVLAVGFLPLLTAWTCIYVVWPWRFYDCFDPEGIHYASGLSILNGHGPGNVDNPATPLQSLSAILCWLTGCGILDQESFRPLAYAVIIGLRIFAAAVLLRSVPAGIPQPLQVVLIWIPWLAPDFSMMSRQWCPEILYFPLGLIAAVVLARNLNQSDCARSAFVAGLPIGMMIGVKFIFVTWAAAAVMAIAIKYRPSVAARSGLAITLGTMAGFIAATLPAISRYPRMLDWIVGLATRTGQYGTGESGLFNLKHVGDSAIEVLLHQKAWTLVVIAVVIGLLLRKPRTTISIFCILAIAGSYALALKHFAPRYLAPTGLIVLLAATELFSDNEVQASRRLGWITAALVGLMLSKSLLLDITIHRSYVAGRRASERALTEFLAEHGRTPQSVILYGWRAFTPAFTARFLSQSEQHRFDSEVDAGFPYEGIIRSWPDELSYPMGKSDWDFIVLGEEFPDLQSIQALKTMYPTWRVDRYIVFSRHASGLANSN